MKYKLMMSMLMAAVLSLPASSAEAQGKYPAQVSPKKKSPFPNIRYGDRVEIVLKTGALLRGQVVCVLKDRLTIDTRFDSPELAGTITVRRGNIRSLKKLVSLPEESIAEFLRKLRQKWPQKQAPGASEGNKQPVPSRTKQQVSPEKGKPAPGKKAAPEKTSSQRPAERRSVSLASLSEEDKQLFESLLKKFPPGAEWNQSRHNIISATPEQERTEQEKEFLKVYPQWQRACQYQEIVERQKLPQKFPPEEGWNDDKYQNLRRQLEVNPGLVSADEKEFVLKYQEWKQALQEREHARSSSTR